MEYFVADTYKDFTYDLNKAYKNTKGNLVVDAKEKCPRCSGTGIFAARVENGHIIPHPAYNGVCLKCNGNGTIYKTIRLYTKTEYNKMQKAKEKRQVKKLAEAEKRMEEDAKRNKEKWLQNEGFNEEGITYIIKGETYSIKDELKAAGFRFNCNLLWHIDHLVEEYTDRLLPINIKDIVTFTAWGRGEYILEAIEKLKKEITIPAENPLPNGGYLEESKFSNLTVTLVKKHGFDGMYGWTNIFTFVTEDDKTLTWFTATEHDIEIGTKLLIRGSVKDRKEYKGVRTTIVTRCKLAEASVCE